MPQRDQDELYDFYCRFGQTTKEGNHTGLFRRASAVRDNSQLDIAWEDFKAGQLTPTLAAQDAARSNDSRQEHMDALDLFMHGPPPLEP